jgi:hypothetical protein
LSQLQDAPSEITQSNSVQLFLVDELGDFHEKIVFELSLQAAIEVFLCLPDHLRQNFFSSCVLVSSLYLFSLLLCDLRIIGFKSLV